MAQPKRTLQRTAMSLLALCALAACTDGAGDDPAYQAVMARDSGGGARSPASAGSAAAAGLPDFAALVERFGNAVVNVEVVGSRRVVEQEEDPLMDFFRQFGVPSPDGRQVPEHGDTLLMRGAGSGFIVSADGYILTNAHVIAGADEVTVRLTDRREFPAKVVGSDAHTDVAVIKIEGRDLPVVRIGNRRAVKTGEWVLAIGSPFGLENTATAGIVSSTSRAVSGALTVPFIQTDVAVNPGNSGGPLFNLDGEVIGMNSMIFSETGGYMGISFAIPIDLAMDVRAQLVATGHVVRGRIGVVAQDVDADLARSFGLDRPHGALVSQVEKGGPAARAGVKPGDVILSVGKDAVEQSADLSNAVARIAPGRDTPLRLWRGGRSLDVTVRVARLEEPPQQARAGEDPARAGEAGARLGLVVRPLTPEEKQRAGTTGNVVVEGVGGAAARAGMQPGDIILAVNNRAVESVKDLRAAADRLREGDAAALLVEREGTRSYVPLRIHAGGQG